MEKCNFDKSKVHVISFSGGRTSAYLVNKMISLSIQHNFKLVVVFCDTGAEHPKTYEFIRNVADKFGVEITCLRVQINPELGKANGYEVININDCRHDLGPWKAMMKKYGTPYNPGGAFCTDRLKLVPYTKYLNETYGKGNYTTWLGIRADEPKRIIGDKAASALKRHGYENEDIINVFKTMRANDGDINGEFDVFDGMFSDAQSTSMSNERREMEELIESGYTRRTKDNKYYLAEISSFTKEDIIKWWSAQEFDLGIPEHLGNCAFCIKKSVNKIALAIKDEPELANQFSSALNCETVRIVEKRKTTSLEMYRGHLSFDGIAEMYSNQDRDEIAATIKGGGGELSGSCSESCEVFNQDNDNFDGDAQDYIESEKKYSLIYADPAWSFNSKNSGGSMTSGAANKYRVSSLEEMTELDVESIAADDCVLAMWWVGAMPKEAIALVESWGFTIKNMNGIVWNKLTKTGLPFFGMGFWTRAGSESILIATKGKPKPASRSVRAVFRAEAQIQFEAMVMEHSRKPEQVRDMLVELAGDVPRLEMFCRGSAPGWDVWGDQSVSSGEGEPVLIPRRQVDGGFNLKKWLKQVSKLSWAIPFKKSKPAKCHEKEPEDILKDGC